MKGRIPLPCTLTTEKTKENFMKQSASDLCPALTDGTAKAVIFDLDGVLVTTDNCHFLAWDRMARDEGIPFDRKINERLRGVSRMESLAIILEKSPRSYTEAEKTALAERKNSYYKELIGSLTQDAILPGALAMLDFCRVRGLKTAIGSSSKNTKAILGRLGLADRFDAVADGNDIKHSKPAPDVFLCAAEKLGLPADVCLVAEDADAGIAAARAAGMRVMGIGPAAGNPDADFALPQGFAPLL